MAQQFALLSIVFMMGFVIVFDRVHREGSNRKFCKNTLLSSMELDQLRSIMAACQDC